MSEAINTVSGVTKQSIARVELFTDAALSQDDMRLVVHFEDGLYDASGKLLAPTQFGTRQVNRQYGKIKDVSVTAGGVTATVAQIGQLIRAACYTFRKEDMDAAASAPLTTPEPKVP